MGNYHAKISFLINKMSSLETKTAGTKQSFFQQILGNFGVPGMKRGGPILGSGKADD